MVRRSEFNIMERSTVNFVVALLSFLNLLALTFTGCICCPDDCPYLPALDVD